MQVHKRLVYKLVVIGLGLCLSVPSIYAQTMDHSKHKMDDTKMTMDHSKHMMDSSSDDPHAGHKQMMNKTGYTVTFAEYPIIDVTLLNSLNRAKKLDSVITSKQPIALNFIFTTCTTICPVMTATFAQMRKELEQPILDELLMVSISIDPSYDRPDVLREYKKKFNAPDDWIFLTGESVDVNNVLRAFDVYAGSKMNHQPITLLRKANSREWIRINGLTSGQDMAKLVMKHLY